MTAKIESSYTANMIYRSVSSRISEGMLTYTSASIEKEAKFVVSHDGSLKQGNLEHAGEIMVTITNDAIYIY